jgi:hypothetical protein
MEVNVNQLSKRVVVALVLCLVIAQTVAIAQNLGAAPQTNVAVQGQTGAQPEGAFLNFVNWIGNVIAPVGAGVAVLGAVGSYATGRGVFRWLVNQAVVDAITVAPSQELGPRKILRALDPAWSRRPARFGI